MILRGTSFYLVASLKSEMALPDLHTIYQYLFNFKSKILDIANLSAMTIC